MTKSSRPRERRAKLFAEASAWLGTRWHHQGRNRAGLDCIGLLVHAYWAQGATLKDCTDYRGRPNPETLLKHITSQFDECELEECEMQLFWWDAGTLRPQHVAILSEDLDRLIHTWASVRKVVDSPRDQLWADRLVSCWKLKEELWLPQHSR